MLLLGVGGVYMLSRSDSSTVQIPDTVDFNQHVRPILSSNCYVCHGPDISTREAGLRLDIRDSAIVELESGLAAVVPGDHRKSELIRRVSTSDEEEQMPPAGLKKKLSAYEVGVLKRWIDQGAEWKIHWSLVPPEETKPPRARRAYVDNDIDRYVVNRLEKEGLIPASVVDKRTLIRRLSYVLTGLPPTPEGVAAFVSDNAPDAYERLVDRLLDSPHFGERWARHWMDVVRYADTRGHEFDFPIVGAWQYRDYLIRAFNQDVPYDAFLTEHLAGDLVATPRKHPEEGFNESQLATAFFALGEGKHSPVDLTIDEAERIDNMIDVTSKAFQGLTLSCAKCHDHKFDPIPTTDYYAWYGIVKSSRFAFQAARAGDQTHQYVEELEALRGQVRRAIGALWKEDIEAQQDNFPQRLTVEALQEMPWNSVPEDSGFTVLGDFRNGSFDGWYATGLGFGDTPVSGAWVLGKKIEEIEPSEERGMVTFQPGVQSLASPRATSAAISTKLVGALRSPTFDIEHDYITVRAAGKRASIRVVVDNFQLIRNPIYGALERIVASDDMETYQLDVSMWKGREAYVELISGWDKGHETFTVDDSSYIAVDVVAALNEKVEPVDQPTQRTATRRLDANKALEIINKWMQNEATAQEIHVLNALLESGVLRRSLTSVSDLLQRYEELEAGIPEQTLFMGVVDGSGRDRPVFVRGDINTLSTELVPRRTLTIVDPDQVAFNDPGSGRLALAHSMTDPANPLTARVMVNRLWHHVFGRGLVDTVDNLGVQGSMPTHPELLDYLALRFMENGWSMKQAIRMMVLSQAFQRTSESSEKAQERDPENKLLQHYPVRRLEAESIRDAMLVVSGRFDPTMYGESVPIYLSPFMSGRGRPGVSGPLDGNGRRSLYISVRRNFLSPMMLVFDMPIPFTTFGRRNTSSVPAQSLTLLNDPFVAEQAGVWADAVISFRELDAGQRIRQMYRTAFSREATDEEVEQGLDFLADQARFHGLDSTSWLNDVRPWTDYCHTLFNMKEFIHVI